MRFRGAAAWTLVGVLASACGAASTPTDGGGDGASCEPDCLARECGDDGCGGLCGEGCEAGEHCSRGVCVPEGYVFIPGSTFEMGCLYDETFCSHPGVARHTVTITRDFIIAETEATASQFEGFDYLGPFPRTTCPECPMHGLSRHGAASYTNWLSELEGLPTCYRCSGESFGLTCRLRPEYESPYDCPGYRLTTEAEWELAARGGTTTATYNGDIDLETYGCDVALEVLGSIAWFCGNSGGEPHPVGLLEPNPFGLYDVLGNVLESCHDGFLDEPPEDGAVDPWTPADVAGIDRAISRGGAWNGDSGGVQVSDRFAGPPGLHVEELGVRPSRTFAE